MIRKSFVLFVAAASCFAFLQLPLKAQNPAAQDVGFVLDLRGDWEIAGPPPMPVRIGQAMPGGGSVRPRSPRPGWFITIVLLDGSTTLTRSCSKTADCSPLVVPNRPKAESLWTRALKTMGALLSRQDETLVPVMSRDVFIVDDEVQAHEAVIALVDGSIDLAAVIRGSAAGRYTVILERLGRKGSAPSSSPFSASVGWDPELPAKVGAGHVAPGLYTVTVLPEKDEVYAPTAASAWILVSGPDSFEERTQAFGEAAALTRTWDKSVKKQAIRRFLRAYLEMLADDGSGPANQDARD